ncbi:MAG: site-2 protease family protein [Acidimicrobiia bacterium]
MANAFRLGRILGIEVRIDASWLVLAFLVGWSFYAQFTVQFPELSGTARVALAAVTAAIFFASVLIHELSHSVVARRLGIPVEGITLFLFGGVTRTRMEAQTPRDEFLVGVVGPMTSFVIAGVLWLVVNLGGEALPDPILYAWGYLGWINLALGAFNLLPGYPLDGGRVLRSFLWRSSGNVGQATRRAATVGKVLGGLLVGYGLFSVFGGDLGGLWMAAIGWFLFQAAAQADQEVVVRRLLNEVRAGDIMTPELVTIPADTTIADAVDDFFLRYDHSAFPVDGERTGLLTLRAVRQIPRDQWEIRQVWTATTPLDETCTVSAETPMDQVMEKLREQDEDRVLVVEDGHIAGIITPRDIARWLRRSEELGLTESRS